MIIKIALLITAAVLSLYVAAVFLITRYGDTLLIPTAIVKLVAGTSGVAMLLLAARLMGAPI